MANLIRQNCSHQFFELVKLLQNTRFFLCFQLSVGEFLKTRKSVHPHLSP